MKEFGGGGVLHQGGGVMSPDLEPLSQSSASDSGDRTWQKGLCSSLGPGRTRPRCCGGLPGWGVLRASQLQKCDPLRARAHYCSSAYS